MKCKSSPEVISQAVKLSAQGKTGEEIAQALGVSRRTVVRWLADPGVQPAIERERKLHDARFWRDVRRIRNGIERKARH